MSCKSCGHNKARDYAKSMVKCCKCGEVYDFRLFEYKPILPVKVANGNTTGSN